MLASGFAAINFTSPTRAHDDYGAYESGVKKSGLSDADQALLKEMNEPAQVSSYQPISRLSE